ncbi:MAG TPA: hypothetical protein VLA61_12980 [Ideonella sp.]|uniref:hypothetical protein n=1 Tax=Ideonella sp. TaxID=1929293 RepID=UPI002CCA7F51|nr:hypothetical protein [Ideonella sp.]HSI49179.1 hypothetical protein [Ideonella sp.]
MTDSVEVSPVFIANLLLGACPERASELEVFWEKFEPRFAVKDDGAGLDISARGNKVSWMHKTFVHDWVVAFAGFKALAAYGPHVWSGEAFSGEISTQALSADEGLCAAEAELETLLYFAKQLGLVADLEELDWPGDVPPPGTGRELLASTEDQACFDIACLAAAATFLHELRHVQFSAEKNAPTVRADEERACDDFSRTMLLERVDVYSATTGEVADRVASKRVIGLASAALAIAQAESQSMASAVQNSHPPIRRRFVHLVLEADVADNATCWSYTACLLIALLRRGARLPQQVQFDSPKNLCQQLVDLL